MFFINFLFSIVIFSSTPLINGEFDPKYHSEMHKISNSAPVSHEYHGEFNEKQSDFSTRCGCHYTYFEDCANGEDDDYDGLIDCEDADCQESDLCPEPQGELCFTNEDEDGDGFAGCEDQDCISFYPCTASSDPTRGYDDNLYGCKSSPTSNKPPTLLLFFITIFALIKRSQ